MKTDTADAIAQLRKNDLWFAISGGGCNELTCALIFRVIPGVSANFECYVYANGRWKISMVLPDRRDWLIVKRRTHTLWPVRLILFSRE